MMPLNDLDIETLVLESDGGVAEQNPFLNLMLAVLVPSDPSEALTRETGADGLYCPVAPMRRARTSAKDGLRLVLPPIWLCFLKTF